MKLIDAKDTSLNAKMETVVKSIRLVENNIEQIEGQAILILAKCVREQG